MTTSYPLRTKPFIIAMPLCRIDNTLFQEFWFMGWRQEVMFGMN